MTDSANLRRAVLALVLATVAIALVPGGAGASGLDPFTASRAKVWAVGDGAVPTNRRRKAALRVARMIEQHHVDRFLYLGDVYQTGTAADFALNYQPTYGRFNEITAPTIGNHDYDNRATGYEPYWQAVLGEPIPEYYPVQIGDWQVLSLNSQGPHDAASPQLAWLTQTLNQTPGFGTCRIAFWHQPRYSAGLPPEGHGDNPDMQAVWDALAGKAILALSGHAHDMQRLAPIDGITQLVAGSGGNWLDPVDASYPGLRFGDDSHVGALRLSLHGTGLRFSFLNAHGTVLNSGKRACQPGP